MLKNLELVIWSVAWILALLMPVIPIRDGGAPAAVVLAIVVLVLTTVKLWRILDGF